MGFLLFVNVTLKSIDCLNISDDLELQMGFLQLANMLNNSVRKLYTPRMLLLLLLPDLAESLGDAKMFGEIVFPVWAIQDLVLNLGIYDWSVRRDVEFLDLVGNLYKFGMSASFQAPLLHVSLGVLKDSRNKIKTILRIALSIPFLIVLYELLISLVITVAYLQFVLMEHVGYLVGMLATLLIVFPLVTSLLVVIGFVSCYPVLKMIWKNEKYFLSFGENQLRS